jgi:hypothetical protein
MLKIYPSHYYKYNQIEVPPDLAHRHIKLKLANGKWVMLGRIKTKKDLQIKLIELGPTHAYISCSTYLNPNNIRLKWKMKKIYPKWLMKANLLLNNLILQSDFVLDFDDGKNSFPNLIKAYNYLKDNRFYEFKFVKTKRGFHLWVLDFYKKRCTDNERKEMPHERELYIEAQKILLANELFNEDIHFDYKVAVDTRRIFRIWNSLYNDGYTICKLFNSLDLLTKCEIANVSHSHKLDEVNYRPMIKSSINEGKE